MGEVGFELGEYRTSLQANYQEGLDFLVATEVFQEIGREHPKPENLKMFDLLMEFEKAEHTPEYLRSLIKRKTVMEQLEFDERERLVQMIQAPTALGELTRQAYSRKVTQGAISFGPMCVYLSKERCREERKLKRRAQRESRQKEVYDNTARRRKICDTFSLTEDLVSPLMPPTLEARREALAVILKNRADADLANTKTFLENDRSLASCDKFHYRMILRPWTDVSLGDCSYLDTCRNLSTCKFIHYEVELSNAQKRVLQYEIGIRGKATFTRRLNVMSYRGLDTPPQWISCDIRDFPMKMFNGLVSVVMADPPWDIHMELPYGTMADDEMRHLPIHLIQNHGLIFLWVTGRAMELGKECLKLWGYEQVEEIVWVKTNQLHRLIRTGRTGHWINHSKEHCLIGIKGSPNYFPFLDCDVIVSEVRETSRKPDEIYKLIERLAPDSLKLELFGRMHNTCRNWITLGNQLDGVNLVHSRLIDRYNAWRPSHLPEVAYPADSPGFHGKSDKPVSGESVFSIESL